MSGTENAIFTNLCMVLDGKGNVLIQERLGPTWPGIAFPGGHVEKGEAFTDAVVREVREETGLTVSDLQLCGIKNWLRDDGTRYIVFLYKTDRFEGELASSDEGEVRWVPLDELPNMKLSRGMQATLKLFCDDGLTELFFHIENGEWLETFK